MFLMIYCKLVNFQMHCAIEHSPKIWTPLFVSLRALLLFLLLLFWFLGISEIRCSISYHTLFIFRHLSKGASKVLSKVVSYFQIYQKMHLLSYVLSKWPSPTYFSRPILAQPWVDWPVDWLKLSNTFVKVQMFASQGSKVLNGYIGLDVLIFTCIFISHACSCTATHLPHATNARIQ